MLSREFKTLLVREIQESLRNKWLIIYAVIYAVLGLSLSYYSVLGLSYLGLKAFGRVSAALVNLTLYMVPLMSLSLAGLSLVTEREKNTLEMLLAQPVSKTEVAVSRYLGITLSIFLSTFLGYGLAAWYLWLVLSSGDIVVFLQLMLISLLAASTLSAVGLLISILSRTRFEALATVLLTWLTLVVIYDLLVMGVTLIADLKVADILNLLILNPVESARILMVQALDPSLLLLGATGLYIARTLGSSITMVFTASMLAWTASCLAAAVILFNRQDL
ncbi:MAG: ABC transporter permease [Candidatus Caldarchaeum sp.]